MKNKKEEFEVRVAEILLVTLAIGLAIYLFFIK